MRILNSGGCGRKPINDVESVDGLDVMMLCAEQMNIPLTAIWHAVRGWHTTGNPDQVRSAS